MRKSLPKRDQLLLRIGAAKKEAGRAFGFVKTQIPQADQAVTRETFSFHVDKAKLKATEQRDGHYLLRSNLTGEDPAVLWTRYVQLTQIEGAFRCLKGELSIRPIHHQLEHQADAHVLIAFLAYCLHVTLKTTDDSRDGTDARRSVREACHDSDDRGLDSHARWPLAGPATPYRAGQRRSGGFGPHSNHLPSQPPPRIKASLIAPLTPPEPAD